MNKWIGIGRLTKAPELRRTGTGKAVASFTVAIDDGYGENKSTDFIDIVAWEKVAENCSKFLDKGSKVAVEGKLKKRSYEKDGRKIYIWEVNASSVEFLDSKAESKASALVNASQGATWGGYKATPDFSVIDDDDAQLPF